VKPIKLSWDIGFRLGQNSEFSLLIAYIAFNTQLIGNNASHLIQAAAIITFLISSYIVGLQLPQPYRSDRPTAQRLTERGDYFLLF
jgi:predicted Kef-type K+ transport protein